ncbi:MAG TPA: endopeptidase La [Ktedonobacterales bacterium]|jgi:ATP-dependent Lon protease|nr:endopeptidase La [Ktedonobacterales bacterium]
MDHPRRPSRRVRAARTAIHEQYESLFNEGAQSFSLGAHACELPALPVRNAVLLPHMALPLFVDRAPALLAIEAALERDRLLLIVTQRDETITEPTPDDVYTVGAECAVTRVLKLPDGSRSVEVQSLRRFRIEGWTQESPYGRAMGKPFEEPLEVSDQLEALRRSALSLFESCVKLNAKLTEEILLQAYNIAAPGPLADFLVAQLDAPLPVRQEMLETFQPAARLKKVCQLLKRELHVIELERKIQDDVQREVDTGQREYFLREQIKVMQRELGERDPAAQERDELRARVLACGMPEMVQARALKELSRLESMPSMSPEHTVLTNYLDWLVSVPWQATTRDHLDLSRAADTLEANHFGLERVKERVLEYIAIRKLAPTGRAPILCLVGPPGVGKTSLGRSIAEAIGRNFVRVSLGGVRDEAEIRGHRRTYVGALPGRIIQAMKTAGTRNPVFLLDEVDKLASDYRGDPSAALLEVLDPEQNAAFSDHYLEVPYDLSQALFILTANVLHTIPGPLRDRLEIIEVPGYTEEEKLQIARRFLVPRQMRDTGLSASRIEITDDGLRRMIREYTYESGVRNLEREIGAVMRRVARRVVEGSRAKATISARNLPAYLGQQKHFTTEAEERDEIGVATGLAWTSVGGDLTTVEVMAVPGHGNLILTGQLGDVMKESAQAALTYARARATVLGLPDGFHETSDLHVHLPAGGIPKDGPSAGVTMATALISALTGRLVRSDVAMTGEITLRGRILPVGGVKEKALAAHRAGIAVMILPRRNLKDLDELAPYVRERMTFTPVETMDEVLAIALAPTTTAASAPRRKRDATEGIARVPITSTTPAVPIAATGRVARSRARREPNDSTPLRRQVEQRTERQPTLATP